MDFPSNSDTTYHDLPDFQTSRAMNILVHCTKKKAYISHSTFGYLSACSAQSKTDFDNALMHTADTLCSSLDTFDSLFGHSDDTPPSLVETSPPKSRRVPVQSHYPKQASQEMFKAGLTESSRLLHSFSQPGGSDDRDLPPQCTFTLDPFSEECHAKLRAELRLDADEYSHVNPAVLAKFDTGCHPLSSRQCAIKSTTCYDKISFNPQSPLGVLQRYLYTVRIYMVKQTPPDLWLIIVRLIQSLRVMAFLFLKSSISWTGLAEAKHLPN